MDDQNLTLDFENADSTKRLEQQYLAASQSGASPRIEDLLTQVSDETRGPLVERLLCSRSIFNFSKLAAEDVSAEAYRTQLSGFDECISRAFEQSLVETPGNLDQSLIETRSSSESNVDGAADYSVPITKEPRTASTSSSWRPRMPKKAKVRRVYDDEFKREAVRMLLDGHSA